MREYMANYRQKPEKREALRGAHRVDSFLWRVSKPLGPRYDILMCDQAGPFLIADLEENIKHNQEHGVNTIDHDELDDFHQFFGAFSMFILFAKYCSPGGNDIFKVFSYIKDSWQNDIPKTAVASSEL
jgi:hypothetical protein